MAGAAAAALILALAAAPAGAQTADDEDSGYDFFGVSALADGITTRFVLGNFLAVEELVALSSVSAEARLEIGRSTALAVLPDPGDLVLGLSGTLAALAGVGGLPDYPAVSRADYPTTPEDNLSLAPDAGLGALRLHTEAQQHRALGRAFIGDFVDTVGVVPLTVGGIKTESVARRIDPLSYESTATSIVNDVRLLGGLFRIASLTSTVTTRVDDGKITASQDDTKIAGAVIAGMPVGIDENGFTSPQGSSPLAPIVETLAAPLKAAGITVKMTPGERSVSPTKGTATSAFLSIEYTTLVQGLYPATLSLGLGKSSATVEASGRAGSFLDDVLGDTIGGLDDGDLSVPSLDATGDALDDVTDGVVGGALTPGSGNIPRVTTPVAAVKPMDFRSLYRWTALAMAVAVALRWWGLPRLRAAASADRSKLRSLWRW